MTPSNYLSPGVEIPDEAEKSLKLISLPSVESKMEYTEPDYSNITKRELFDEDVMKPLLIDPRYNKGDRCRLSNYNRHRISGSIVNVCYKFGGGCAEYKLGRLFPVDGVGLQSFRFDMRNPLADKWYWDIDVENAHYVIAYNWCVKYGIVCDNIKHYIMNRDESLALVSSSRKKAKTEFLKVLYGGNIKLYTTEFNEVEGDITSDGYTFLQKIKKEVDALMTMIWDNHKQYHTLKTGSDKKGDDDEEKKAINKKRNPKASLMSLLFQTEERKILMVIDWVLTKKGRYLATFIHDGGYVEKLEGEEKFPNELLSECAEAVKTIMGYDVNITQKPIKYDWKPYKPQESQYDVMKKEFEERNFMIGHLLNCIHADGNVESLRISDARIKFSNKIVNVWDDEKQKTVKKKFLELWLEDPKRKEYERMDFYPNREACPSTIYNLFKGFEAEKHKCELTQEQIMENVEPIIKHINYITSGYADNFLKWLANIIQTPHRKSEIAQVIRDQGGLLIEGGGTGKNLLIEWFGTKVLGEEYFVVVGDNKELYSSFNSLFEAKLLVFVEEASGRENHSNTDTLKSKITSKKTNVNKKCVAQYKVNDYSRYLFSSNNRNPLPIRQGDRRFTVYDTNPVMRGDTTYFTDLATKLDKPEVIYSFYCYLKTLHTYTSPIDFWNNSPITDAYLDVRRLNAPLYHKWIIQMVRRGELENNFTSELYKQFTKWVEINKERSTEGIITQTSFGKLLTDASSISDPSYSLGNQGVKGCKGGGYAYMTWDIPDVVDGLKKLHLLESEFEYKEKELLQLEETPTE
jgi:hypothetical protein